MSDSAIARLRLLTGDTATDPDARYVIHEALGQGGMGVVYRCWDAVLEREVAMKVTLAPTGPGSAELADRLRTEARVLARLEHAGIVPVHDAGRLPDGRVFYIMKRIHGRTLAAMMSDGDNRPPLSRRLDMVERVAEAVAFAHDQGVVHRDLSPSNVMIGDFGEVLVTDWGVAKVMGDAGSIDADTVLGTPGYMAPEQAQGKAEALGPSADVYALGAVLRWIGGPDTPPAIRSVIARCMESDPQRRYRDAGELLEELRRHRNGERVLAHEESWLARVARVLKPWRTPILLIAAYLVMRVAVAYFNRI
ncbi:MAG: serine/threonine protein kinase [Gemmatimonadaceae bacterium]|nr:serine/threonine protein kinase [Gemmatimonadaceae bacterium]